MNVLYFAYANDPTRPLNELKREDTEINRLLEPLAAKGRFRIVRDQYATLEAVADKLRTYQNDLVLFHYSGHAGPDRLDFEGGTGKALGLGELLAACPNLQVVILNGCATAGQVRHLHARGVPAVVATNRPVEDLLATNFAIELYRGLEQNLSLEIAFNAARSLLLAYDDEILVDNSRGLAWQETAASAIYWGLSLAPGRDDLLEWRLPHISKALNNFKPNQLLLEILLNALAEYHSGIAEVIIDPKSGMKRKIKVVLEALPHPVSELLRGLLAEERNNTMGQQFFDRPGLPRLRQMVALYTTITELIAFIMLAQLWDELRAGTGFTIGASTRVRVRQLFQCSKRERSGYDFVGLIASIRDTLKANTCEYFVEELRAQGEIFGPGEQFAEACQFFAELKQRIDKIGESEAADICADAEAKLALVMGKAGFVVRYTIASVKEIDVLKYRHESRSVFRHQVVPLVQTFVGVEEEHYEIDSLDAIFDRSSVLLLRKGPHGASFLTLTPFIIDVNAFDPKASLAKLHYFEQYVPALDGFTYRHIYMPAEQPMLIREEAEYAIIKAQFEAFAQLVFNEPMRILTSRAPTSNSGATFQSPNSNASPEL